MQSLVRRFRVDPREIHYVRFILEGYDGLAVFDTEDPATGLLRVRVSPENEKDLLDLFRNLAREIFLDPVEAAWMKPEEETREAP